MGAGENSFRGRLIVPVEFRSGIVPDARVEVRSGGVSHVIAI